MQTTSQICRGIAKRRQGIEWREMVAKALRAGVIQVEPCDLSKLVTLEKRTDSRPPDAERSASPTLVVLGRLRYLIATDTDVDVDLVSKLRLAPRDVVMKINFGPRKPRNPDRTKRFYLRQLDYEVEFYKNIVTPLIEERFTPHLIVYLGAFTCNNVKETLQRQMKDSSASNDASAMACDLQKTMAYIEQAGDAEDYNFDTMHVLLLERGKGAPLKETDLSKLDAKQQASMIMQVLYTLACFDGMKARHNDLHQGNVWLETGQRDLTNVYFLSDDEYLIVPALGTLVKLYDFDLASTYGRTTNRMGNAANEVLRGEFCDNYGMCNWRRNSKFDCYMFLATLWYNSLDKHPTHSLAPKITQWVLKTFEGTSLIKQHPDSFPFWAHACKIILPRDGKDPAMCAGNWEPTDKEWPSTMSLIRSLAAEFGFARTLDSGFPAAMLPESGFHDLFRLPHVPASAVANDRLRSYVKPPSTDKNENTEYGPPPPPPR